MYPPGREAYRSRRVPKSLGRRSWGVKNILNAFLFEASVFFLPNVIKCSANLCASFALGYVVEMDSWVKREVTRFLRSA